MNKVGDLGVGKDIYKIVQREGKTAGDGGARARERKGLILPRKSEGF